MRKEVKKQLNDMIEILSKDKIIVKIYLFGSQAKDTFNDNSDIDIAIIVKDDTKERNEILAGRYYFELFDVIKKEIDLLVFHESDFNKQKSNNFLISSKINKEGVVLYGQ